MVGLVGDMMDPITSVVGCIASVGFWLQIPPSRGGSLTQYIVRYYHSRSLHFRSFDAPPALVDIIRCLVFCGDGRDWPMLERVAGRRDDNTEGTRQRPRVKPIG